MRGRDNVTSKHKFSILNQHSAAKSIVLKSFNPKNNPKGERNENNLIFYGNNSISTYLCESGIIRFAN
jgi:hypothetical protein